MARGSLGLHTFNVEKRVLPVNTQAVGDQRQ